MSGDKYPCYRQLAEAEKEGKDFVRIVRRRPGSSVAVIAPHGGGIEPRTDIIAQEMAGAEFSFYCFRGLKKTGNRGLHITSERFDEPNCLQLVADHRCVVAIHGCRTNGERVFIGGLDRTLVDGLASALAQVAIRAESTGHEYRAVSGKNICNRGSRNAGVQLELSMGFRQGQKVHIFTAAVREVLLRGVLRGQPS